MKTIELTNGSMAIVDDEDYERMMVLAPWGISGRYVVSTRFKMRMHHEVMGALPNQRLDHKNRNRLDNQKENLRFSNPSQSAANRGMFKNNTSGYKGVSWHKLTGKWSASIRKNSVSKHIGLFSTPEEAARAYDKKAREIHGEFACLNFSELAPPLATPAKT